MGKHSEENLFESEDFRNYVNSWVKAKGRGEFRRISLALGVHTTLVSQIMGGQKCFTEEQAGLLCIYMGLNSSETDYFLKLIQLERAGIEALRNIFRRHLKELRDRASEVRHRVPKSKDLSTQDRAQYYSSWQYTYVRLLTDIPDFQTAETISAHLKISISRVQEILDFLVSRKLCVLESGRYKRTQFNTHVEASSALSTRHHQNWRVKSLEFYENLRLDDLAFTAPVTIAQKDIPKVKEILLDSISRISKVVQDSPAERVIYLAMDWISFSAV